MLKLYYGTTETIAKAAPHFGISQEGLILTDRYGAYQAFEAYDPQKNERWAIIEILVDRLKPGRLKAHPHFKTKSKRTWQKSVDMVGLCLYLDIIPAQAISRVWIFNPHANWLITRAIIHNCPKKLEVINRWMTGGFVKIDEWLGEQTFTKEQKDRMGNLWNDRSGLDLFYHG